ncbi:MAG TPA: hypothetical protein VKY27_05555 [Bacteriovoracaceae bacterium]|nr:hypothetical protein [Bacteriovoracaceae bacterium]
MNNSIQSKGEEVSIVIYDSPLPPKYFTFKKSFLRTLLFLAPLILLIIFSALFIWAFGSQLKYAPKPKFPELINKEQARILELEGMVKELSVSNKNLAEKLSSTPETQAPSEVINLLAIKKPYGMQNLISKNMVTLDNLKMVQSNNQVQLDFHIISMQETRISGHVLVFLLSNNQLVSYPEVSTNSLIEGIKYTQGEAFSVTRLRPTLASFPRPLVDTVKFIIYVFTREGDLLLMQETQEFKLEKKI